MMVIDCFEVVDVDHEYARRLLQPLTLGEEALPLMKKRISPQEPSQLIHSGHMLESLQGQENLRGVLLESKDFALEV
jgi:hypothetical protein